MKNTLQTLSICPCGFPALITEITLGTCYEINPLLKVGFDWTCGGCRAKQKLFSVWAVREGQTDGGYLPEALFAPPFFRCPDCGAVSYNGNDIANGYCGRCHDFTRL